jgi:LysM repeat protein
VVKAGDTLFSIARRHEVTVADLRSWNGITGNTIAVGQRLRLRAPAASPRTQPVTPQRPPATPTPRTDEPARAARGTPQAQDADATVPRDTLQEYGRHEVVPGETLYGIGLRYGLPVDTLLALNPDLGTMLEPGLVLQLPPAFATVSYRVRQGDTLGRIAQQYGVEVAALKQANGLRNDILSVGQDLLVPAADARPVYDEPRLPEVVSSGAVLVYPDTFEGRLTASGTPYQPGRFTASHQTLPIGSIVLLTNPGTGRSTFAEINDRGPVNNRFVMDVSDAVARQLELDDEDNRVEVRAIQ